MSRPRLRHGPHLAPGIVAVALFAVFAVVILRAGLGDPAGFPEGASVTRNIGYALLNVESISGEVMIDSEGFLVSFILIAIVLDAALDGARHLAQREEEGEIVTALRTDGGEQE